MKILVVDDELLALDDIVYTIKTVMPDADIYPFNKVPECKNFIQKNKCEIAFLDIRISNVSGLELAKYIKEIHPTTKIIFVTAYNMYAVDAFKLHISGYIMKPASVEDVKAEIDYILHETKYRETSNKLHIQCFGNFEVFYNKKPLYFRYKKTKELFAYLIDRRGSSMNTSELCSILWEDEAISKAMKSQFRNFIADLQSTLHEIGVHDVFVKGRNSFAIDTEAVDCDYYRFLDGDIDAVNKYMGEYMSQYSWAEITLGALAFNKVQEV